MVDDTGAVRKPREGLEWEAVVASKVASAGGSWAWVTARIRDRAEITELTEARPRSGSRLPSWAAWSRT